MSDETTLKPGDVEWSTVSRILRWSPQGKMVQVDIVRPGSSTFQRVWVEDVTPEWVQAVSTVMLVRTIKRLLAVAANEMSEAAEHATCIKAHQQDPLL